MILPPQKHRYSATKQIKKIIKKTFKFVILVYSGVIFYLVFTLISVFLMCDLVETLIQSSLHPLIAPKNTILTWKPQHPSLQEQWRYVVPGPWLGWQHTQSWIPLTGRWPTPQSPQWRPLGLEGLNCCVDQLWPGCTRSVQLFQWSEIQSRDSEVFMFLFAKKSLH